MRKTRISHRHHPRFWPSLAPVVLFAGFFVGPSCSPGGSPSSVSPPVASGSFGLSSGWVLLSTAEEQVATVGLPKDKWQALRIESQYDAGSGSYETRFEAAEELAPNGTYWVYIQGETGTEIQDPMQTFPPGGSAWIGAAGELVHVRTPVRVAGLRLKKALRWDAHQQALTEVDRKEMLPVGVYWHYPEEGCGASIPALGGALQTIGSCGRSLPGGSSGRLLASDAPMPPKGLVAWTQGGRFFVRWDPPEFLVDGTSIPDGVRIRYEVHLDMAPVETVEELAYESDIPDLGRIVPFYVKAVLDGAYGEPEVSKRSEVIDLEVAPEKPKAIAGRFEEPSTIADPGSASQPVVAFSKSSAPNAQARDQGLTHLAYVVRGGREGKGDEIRYTQSGAFGKAGSFEPARRITSVGADAHITEVALSAKANRVVVVWLEVSKNPSGTGHRQSRIMAAEGSEAGKVFATRQPVRVSAAWKRSVDVGIDRLGRTHLVWGEGNKAYYLQGLSGDPENVFDQRKRTPNEELVSYTRVSFSACAEDPCGCPERTEKTYPLARDMAAPGDGSAGANASEVSDGAGAYFYRTEEAFVEHPSLHVDDEKVTIVARQTRMYDNLPVKNDHWSGTEGPFYREAARGSVVDCKARRFVATRKGFRHAWKSDQYACAKVVPEDHARLYAEELKSSEEFSSAFAREDLYSYDSDRGHEKAWYQYEFDGRWHEEDAVKVAQRPLKLGAWSKLGKAKRNVPVVDGDSVKIVERKIEVEEGWKQGAWIGDSLQDWRISTVEHFASEGAEVRATIQSMLRSLATEGGLGPNQK